MHSAKPYLAFALLALLFLGCTKADLEPLSAEVEPDTLSSNKDIISFVFLDSSKNVIPDNSIAVTFANDSFFVVFPSGTRLTHLTPTITIKGMSIDPASGVQQDFSLPVKYTVTAEDSSVHSYVVVAKVKAFAAVYFGAYTGRFYALDPDNGSLIWEYVHQGGNFVYSDPLVVDNTLFAGSTDGYMCSFDAVTGAVRWKFYTGGEGIESPAALKNGILYFGSSNDKFYAVDEATGELKWIFQTYFNVSTRAIFYDNNVIFGSDDGNVYALDAVSGEFRWNYSMGGMCNQSSPVLHNGVLFIGSRDKYLHAINANDGSPKWMFTDSVCSMEMSTPFVSDGKVFIGSWYSVDNFNQPGSLYAVDEETGDLVWKSMNLLGVGASPVVGEDVLFISPDDGNFYALDPTTGTFIWSRQIYPNGAGAAVSEGTVFVGGGGSHYFYAFDVRSGLTKWKFSLPNGAMTSMPVVVR